MTSCTGDMSRHSYRLDVETDRGVTLPERDIHLEPIDRRQSPAQGWCMANVMKKMQLSDSDRLTRLCSLSAVMLYSAASVWRTTSLHRHCNVGRIT